MRKETEVNYEDVESLKEEIKKLEGRKFRLDCGHHVTMGHHLGSDIMIYNGRKYKICCSLCCY